MKTPMQELLDYTTDLLHTFDSEERVALAVLDYLKINKEAMLEKEKEVMCEFADEFAIECINFHHEKTMSPEQFFNLTFNTKEK